MTMIELMVVIGVAGILFIFLGFEFTGWMGRYNVENQIKTMQADLLNARQRAMEKNIQYVAALSANGYTICEDTNGNNICDAPAETTTGIATTPTTMISKTLSKSGLRYPMLWGLSLGMGPNMIVIDGRGALLCTDVATCTGNIWLTKPGTAGTVYDASEVDYDCIQLSAVKINVGKYDATKVPPCEAK